LHLASIVVREQPPELDPALVPQPVHGTAALAHRAYARTGLDDLLAHVGPSPNTSDRLAGWTLDASLAYRLHFHPDRAAELQAEALKACPLFRVADSFVPHSARPLRLLALVAPGNLMVNVPLDFITLHLDVQLDLLFLRAGHDLPAVLPDHDVAFCAVSEGETATLRRLQPLYAAWPRPMLNDPAGVARLSRDGLSRDLAVLPGLHSATTLRLDRAALAAHRGGHAVVPLLASGAALLIRPVGSHAGDELERVESAAELNDYVLASKADEFFVSNFVDYRSPDGLFRKFRVAFIDGAPLLCHMAASEHWMVHYLNAGMAENADRRADEARAMAGFDAGFAVRHAAAFAALRRHVGLDYFQIDCAELPDGRLLVFEAAVAGIVHLMDPPDLFPYKPAQMQRVFQAFGAMLRRRAAASA
jgi:hypothetical protein